MILAIISDIHEDYLSLQKTFRKIEKYPVDEIICLGDITGFNIPAFSYFSSRNASECLNLIKSNCTVLLAGNHDLYAVRKIPTHQTIFNFPENWYELDFSERKKLAENKVWLYEDNELLSLLDSAEKEFIRLLPEYHVFNSAHGDILFSHSCFPDPSGSTTFFPSGYLDLKQHFAFMKEKNCRISFFGHGHVQGIELCFRKSYQFMSFGEYFLDNQIYSVSCPAIARGNNRVNGFVIFDTESLSLKVIEVN
ncbi:MAG TPA: metallophosphoesterase family protein [Bacteroidia bacterium]|nr:metallophosphoesterase family protein [Sphingobacteriales bacterium]HPD65867.1 metallophosphoesterase family protein [Bacteroidia bacterium]HRS59554.1 metallophosphoesterase family protein [Bacteroidia bacterium]HRU67656.1 metallophosphoesterase family protein [Bacteroidia bacterium]